MLSVACHFANPSPLNLRTICKASFSTLQQRSFKSTQAAEFPEDDSRFLLILGPAGAGKGTISNKLLKDFPRFHHVSTGDILRQHVRLESPLGLQAKTYMDDGKLVPDNLMIDLVMEDATPYLESGQSLLLDGFPRTIDQAKALEKVTHIDLVVNLDVPTETIVERLADRWIHPESGRVYSYSYNPPKVEGKDDVTGEPLIQRDDDKPEAIRKRLDSYQSVTSPLVQFYAEQGLAKTFTGTESDIIYPEIKEFLEQTHFVS